MDIVPIFLRGFLSFWLCSLYCFKSCCLHREPSGQTIDSGAIAQKHHRSFQSKVSQNSGRTQSKYSLVPSKAVLQKCVQMLLWAHCDPHLWWAGLWVILVPVYHCCVSAQAFELALQNTLGVVQCFCCPPHLPVPCLEGLHQVGRTQFHWGGLLLGNVIKKSDLLCVVFQQDQIFCPRSRYVTKESRKDSVDLNYP